MEGCTHCARLEVENEKLREALKPFAAIRARDGNTCDTYPDTVILWCEISAGGIKRARAALAPLKEPAP